VTSQAALQAWANEQTIPGKRTVPSLNEVTGSLAFGERPGMTITTGCDLFTIDF
jgi:hypothetical protein